MTYRIYLDFETRSEIDLKKMGAAKYAAHSSTEILCVAFKEPSYQAELITPYDFDQEYWLYAPANTPDILFVAHNVAFEYAIWHEIMVKRYGYPAIPLSRWRCTMAKSASCGLPAKLELVAKVLELPAQKDMAGNQSMLVLSRPKKDGSFWTPEEKPELFEQLYKYCAQDVLVEQQLDERLPDLSPHEQSIWEMNERINQSGVTIDVPVVKTIVGLSREHKISLGERFSIATGENFKPSQRAKFQAWINTLGYEIEDTQATTLEALLDKMEDCDLSKAIEIALEYNKSSIAKYSSMLNRVSNDGKLRGTSAYHSAHTGRFAGRGVQLQNLHRGGLAMAALVRILSTGDYDFISWAYDDPSPAVAIASAVRGMFIPSAGKEFIVADLSGIEARVLGWLAGQTDKLADFRTM